MREKAGGVMPSNYCSLCRRHEVRDDHNCAYDTALRWKAERDRLQAKIETARSVLRALAPSDPGGVVSAALEVLKD